MKSPKILLTLPDGSTRTICDSLGKGIRLDDRAFEQFLAVIQGRTPEPLHSRLDRELIWLRDCAAIEEPDNEKFFADTKRFIIGLYKRIETRKQQTMTSPKEKTA